MPVTESCQPNRVIIGLNLSRSHRIRHTVNASDGVLIDLRAKTGESLLPEEPGPPPWVREWPLDDAEVPDAGEITHGLGMQFGEHGEASWKIELVDADGAVLEIVKNCSYRNEDGPDDYFDAIRIELVRR